MASNPNTQRTLEGLKILGYKTGIVEKWNAFAWHAKGRGIRQDLFNIIDIIAMSPGSDKIVGIQSTGQDFKGHDRKITEEFRDNSLMWIQSGGGLQLWGWRKLKRGNRKIWVPRIKIYKVEDF